MVDIEINLNKTETMMVRPSKGKSLMIEPLKFGPNKQILKLLDPSTCTQYLGVWIRADGKNDTVLKMIGSDIEAAQRWSAQNILEYSTNEQSRLDINLIANIMQIMEKKGISFKSNGNTHGVPKSSRPQAYLIETVIPSGTTYTKVRSFLRKENILYLHQIQKKDETLMTWMDFTKKYRQTDSGKIPRWFKILESTIIMDEYRNINIAQCEVLGMHKLTDQIPNDFETMQKDTIYIHILNINEIEISTDGSMAEAGSENARGGAAFVTHGMEAEFGIAVDGTLLSTKTEAKTVLLALKAVPYKCKLTINPDTIIREKRIDFNMNKVAAHTGILENEKTDKLAKEFTTLDTVKWTYNANKTAYIPFCRGVELDLNIKHFLSKQTILQAALNWIGNNKIQETIASLDQDLKLGW
ncbi:hypothetical protein G9A89_020393 [Geosiphon pyriformis]|nr:hypothetical protein G9A89_020393 [Geosiphon pyriformis]